MSLLCVYQNYVSTVRLLICCCPSQLIAITHVSSNTTTAMYITSAVHKTVTCIIPSVSVSEYNRWAGHSTTSACISYTRTVCAAPAKQHRHIDLHIRMNHTRTAVDAGRSFRHRRRAVLTVPLVGASVSEPRVNAIFAL